MNPRPQPSARASLTVALWFWLLWGVVMGVLVMLVLR